MTPGRSASTAMPRRPALLRHSSDQTGLLYSTPPPLSTVRMGWTWCFTYFLVECDLLPGPLENDAVIAVLLLKLQCSQAGQMGTNEVDNLVQLHLQLFFVPHQIYTEVPKISTDSSSANHWNESVRSLLDTSQDVEADSMDLTYHPSALGMNKSTQYRYGSKISE